LYNNIDRLGTTLRVPNVVWQGTK